MIINLLERKNVEILNIMCPGWEKKEKDFVGEWDDFVYSILYDKLIDENIVRG